MSKEFTKEQSEKLFNLLEDYSNFIAERHNNCLELMEAIKNQDVIDFNIAKDFYYKQFKAIQTDIEKTSNIKVLVYENNQDLYKQFVDSIIKK